MVLQHSRNSQILTRHPTCSLSQLTSAATTCAGPVVVMTGVMTPKDNMINISQSLCEKVEGEEDPIRCRCPLSMSIRSTAGLASATCISLSRQAPPERTRRDVTKREEKGTPSAIDVPSVVSENNRSLFRWRCYSMLYYGQFRHFQDMIVIT